MRALITGGSASGKSDYAERLAMSLGERRLYVATMQPFGDDAAERIARHRKLRAGRGFLSADRYTDIGGADVPPGTDVILLECIGNLLANELYMNGTADAIVSGVLGLAEKAENIVIVTNEVGNDGEAYGDDTMRYIYELGRVNRALARAADTVTEVICGIPVKRK